MKGTRLARLIAWPLGPATRGKIVARKHCHASRFRPPLMYPQDDIMIMRYELPGDNVSFSRDEAQRANAIARA